MAEIKVITIQAGEELLAALTKLLGSEAAAQINAAVNGAVAEVEEPECDGCPCGCEDPEEIEEPEFAFGEIVEDTGDEDSFTRVYSVIGAADLNVRVTPQGVKVSGVRYEENEGDDSTFNDLFAPLGAYDVVTAFYDEDDATLTVTLFKVPEEGTEVSIDGF